MSLQKLKVGVLASGRGSNFQSILSAIDRGEVNAEVVTVISNKKRAGVFTIAESYGIKKYYIPSKNILKIVGTLKSHAVGLVVLAGYMKIIPPIFLDEFPDRVINIHPSLLPSFPGLNAQQQAFDYGVRVSGCTVHFVDKGVDTGPIIAQRAVPRYSSDDVNDLSMRILEQEHKLLPEVIDMIACGKIIKDGRKITIK